MVVETGSSGVGLWAGIGTIIVGLIYLAVAKGLSNAEIATRLYVSPATVKTHIARTLTKLDARDRAQLIVIAYETRLVRPGEI